MIVGRLVLSATNVVILVTHTVTARVLAAPTCTLGPPLGAVTVVAASVDLQPALSLAPLSASVARAPLSPPLRLPVPVLVSLLVVVCQGDVGLTPASPQLPSFESSSPQGPPEALSTPVSVVRPRPEYRVPPLVVRQAGSVVGSGGRSPASLASPSPLSCFIGLSGKGGSPLSIGSAELEPQQVKVTKRVTSEGKCFFLPQLPVLRIGPVP